MPNLRDDVLLIQTLIKLANFTSKSDDNRLVEFSSTINIDGWFGEQTRRMIQAFEACVREKHLLLSANGVFEPSSPNGYTPEGVIYKIIHLNRFAKQTTKFGSKYNQIPSDSETHPMLRRALLKQRRSSDVLSVTLSDSNQL